MAQTKLQSLLTKAITSCTIPDPWSKFEKHTPYDDAKYSYALRLNTLPPVVRFYYPLVRAASLFSNSVFKAFPYPFRMVLHNGKECVLEALLPTDSTMLIVASSNKLRMNIIDPDGTRIPVKKFSDMNGNDLTMICLTLLRFIYEYDMDKCSGKLFEAVDEMNAGLNTSDPSTWLARSDIPERVLDGAFFMDAAMDVLKALTIDCADTASASSAGEIDNACFASPSDFFSGDLILEHLGDDGWTPQFVTAKGKASIIGQAVITIAEAKQMYKDVFSHRNWTDDEKKDIRSFPDNMPIMPEALRIIGRVAKTRNAPKPVSQIMWRGITSYGKSTGVQQVSCILNIPMMVITCEPNMETSDFLAKPMPRTETIGLEQGLARSIASAYSSWAGSRSRITHPRFKDSIAYLASLPEQDRSDILDSRSFFEVASMDLDAATELLLGSNNDTLEFHDIGWLYSDVTSAIMDAPLLEKIKELESELRKKPAGEPRKETDFVLVVSPFLQALAKGYLVEVQEASRIRNQGVLVGLNEYDRVGSKITLQDGREYFRHKDAIVIYTDNVSYGTCRQMDPSTLRRFDMIIDSFELPKAALWDRCRRNIECNDKALFDECYAIWLSVQEYCAQNAITDGCVSATELERYVQAVMLDGHNTILSYNLDDCVISKATCDSDNQKDIRTAILTLRAS